MRASRLRTVVERSRPAQRLPDSEPAETGSAHWSKLEERGGVLGLRVMFATYRLLGRRAFVFLLYPVVAYFYVTARGARAASRFYLARVRERLGTASRAAPGPLTTFAHILAFGHSILDRAAMWAGLFPSTDIEFDDPAMLERFRQSQAGVVFIGSHLGSLEVLRALGDEQGLKINALVSTRNSPKLNRVLDTVAPRARQRMIEIDSLGPDTVERLDEKIRAGEHIAILADRVSVQHGRRAIHAPFLGAPAPFPEGPFVLASLVACPVYLLFCLKIGGKYRVFIEPFADPLELPRANRREALERAVATYAQRLEARCLMAPTQWFNFFSFWDQPGETSADHARHRRISNQ